MGELVFFFSYITGCHLKALLVVFGLDIFFSCQYTFQKKIIVGGLPWWQRLLTTPLFFVCLNR